MIRVEEISAEEAALLSEADKCAFDQSFVIWRVTSEEGPVLLCGLIRASLLGWCEIWMVPLTAFGLRYTRVSRAMLRKAVSIYPKLMAQVRADEARALRFAEFVGFRELDRREAAGAEWVRYEYGPG